MSVLLKKHEIPAMDKESPTPEQLEAYRNYIRESLVNKRSVTIPNSGKVHAAIMMSELLMSAEKEVLMLVGDFNGDVSGDTEYKRALRYCIDKKVKFTVIILARHEKPSDAYQMLKQYQANTLHNGISDKVEIYFGNAATDQLFKEDNTHFSIFDGENFRLEIDPVLYSAVGGISKPTQASQLVSTFNYYKSVATPETFVC